MNKKWKSYYILKNILGLFLFLLFIFSFFNEKLSAIIAITVITGLILIMYFIVIFLIVIFLLQMILNLYMSISLPDKHNFEIYELSLKRDECYFENEIKSLYKEECKNIRKSLKHNKLLNLVYKTFCNEKFKEEIFNKEDI